jgi:hypothetical protein
MEAVPGSEVRDKRKNLARGVKDDIDNDEKVALCLCRKFIACNGHLVIPIPERTSECGHPHSQASIVS